MLNELEQKIKRVLLFVLAGLILGGLIYMKGCLAGRKTTSLQSSPAVLKPTDKEQVIVDPLHHKIQIVTHGGVKTETLPDRPSTITEHNDGTVTVTASQFGYEQRPFVGYGYSNKFRIGIGCDLFYFKKLDFGPLVTFQPYQPVGDMRLGVLASFNVWSNVRLSIGMDHTGTVNGFVTVRL